MAIRFQFPGYTLAATLDTDTLERELGKVVCAAGEFLVTIRRPKQPENLPFLVQKIEKSGKILWQYGATVNGYARLAIAGDRLVIALIGQGRFGKLHSIVWTSDGDAQVSLSQKFRLKAEAAEFLDREVEWTPNELKARRVFGDRARESEKAAKDAEYEARRAERERKRNEIMARQRTTAFTSDCIRRTGLPVIGDEWMLLHGGTYVILVEALDGKPIEAFRVLKMPGKTPQKVDHAVVSSEMPRTAVPTKQALKTLMIEKGGDLYEVTLYPDMDAIRTARADGLNNGSYVAVDPKVRTPKLTIYAVHSDRVDTIGDCAVV